MLDELTVEEYFDRLKLSEWARDYVRHARESSPSRTVSGGERSMSATWSDDKMPFTQDVESRTHELVFGRQQAADPKVLEIWAQPPPIRIITRDKDDRRHGHWYTPDFLVLHATRCLLAEIKRTIELAILSVKKPDQWQFSNGRWHYVAAEITGVEIGLLHETYCTEDLNPILVRNIEFLRDYKKAAVKNLSQVSIANIRAAVDTPLGVPIARLLPPHGNWDADTIYFAIVQNHIFAPTHDQDLSDTVRCRVYPDRAAYEIVKASIHGQPGNSDGH